LSAREAIVSIRAEIDLQYAETKKLTSIHFSVDQLAGKRRVEHFSDSIEPASFLINGDTVSAYRHFSNSSIEIHGVLRDRSVGFQLACDPRIIGLSDIMSVDKTIAESLWLDTCESAVILPDEFIGDVSCRRVEAMRKNVVSVFWIDDTSFRLIRRSLAYDGGALTIDSKYDGAAKERVLPVSVTAKRIEGASVEEMTLTVKSLEVNVPIPPERFTIQSFNLPINTMRNDYRINQITGYWNGLEFTENPVSAERLPPPAPLKPTTVAAVPRSRIWLIVLNAMALIALGGYAWRRSRVRTR